jgi:N-methylhydantoinase A
MGTDVTDAAMGVSKVVNNHMADLIRRQTIERGYDPRRCVLFAYGGAGPVHCCAYGRNLGVKEIIVPSGLASEYSAFGIAATDLRRTLLLADYMPELDIDRINSNFSRLNEQTADVIKRWDLSDKRVLTSRSIDLKYHRQLYTLTTQIPDNDLKSDGESIIRKNFEDLYEKLYGKGSTHSGAAMEAVNFRLDVVGLMEKPELKKHKKEKPDAFFAIKDKRPAFFEEGGGYVKTPVYDGEKLLAGNRFNGPSIVEFLGTTVVVYPGQRVELDPYLNIVIREE